MIGRLAWVVALWFLAGCGGIGGDDGNPPAAALALLAGNMGGVGNVDGPGSSARFNGPTGAATDSEGNVYIADSGNHTIRKITPSGDVSTFAGLAGARGNTDGIGQSARFSGPAGVATDSADNVYVADRDNYAIRKISPNGAVSTYAGTGQSGYADGPALTAGFGHPEGVATDASGNVYLLDAGTLTVRKVAPDGIVSTMANLHVLPTSIAADNAGNVYVGGLGAVLKITPDGQVNILAGTPNHHGGDDGVGAAASFFAVLGLAADTSGNVYAADSGATIRKITPAGVVTTLAGSVFQRGEVDGAGAAARFRWPHGIATDRSNNLYVSDANAIRLVSADGVVTSLAGTPGLSGDSDGVGLAASFQDPGSLAVDKTGNLYTIDQYASVRKINPDRTVSKLDMSDAFYPYLQGVATDGAGNVYLADTSHRVVRIVTPAGVVSTYAGRSGVSGSTDGTTANALFATPTGVATDSAGNVYVADGNHTIRVITPVGTVSTLAGSASNSGSADGFGATARFASPFALACDSAGNVFAVDKGNATIRKITPAGIVSTLAGKAGVSGSDDGAGEMARFNDPSGIAIDDTDNLYVADTGNHTVRKISPAGVVSTLVGVAGRASFTPGSLPGLLSYPKGVAVSGRSLYITAGYGVAVVQLP